RPDEEGVCSQTAIGTPRLAVATVGSVVGRTEATRALWRWRPPNTEGARVHLSATCPRGLDSLRTAAHPGIRSTHRPEEPHQVPHRAMSALTAREECPHCSRGPRRSRAIVLRVESSDVGWKTPASTS